MFLGKIKFYTSCFVLTEMYIRDSNVIVLVDCDYHEHKLMFYTPDAAEKGLDNIWKCLTQNGYCSVDAINLKTGDFVAYGKVFD